MATYKVLQDIEAEDKFLGPLTLKQCIFAAVAAVSGYLCFVFISRGVWVMSLPLLPVIIVTGFLAFPWGRDQPTEVWLLAKIRFMFKPRKRTWDQSGVQELVRVTAPPKVEKFVGDNLKEHEVRSRLKALADTIDSRGWAVKGAPSDPWNSGSSSDRLVEGSALPSVASGMDIDEPVTDMFDSPLANKISSQISTSSSQRIQTAQQSMTTPSDPMADNLWFMNQPTVNDPSQAVFTTQSQVVPQANDTLSPLFSQQPLAADDAQLLGEIKAKKELQHGAFRNHRSIDPNGYKTPSGPVTAASTPATINLARNNDRTIDSIAREAGDSEVVVPLH